MNSADRRATEEALSAIGRILRQAIPLPPAQDQDEPEGDKEDNA